jgi:hypothetical protein
MSFCFNCGNRATHRYGNRLFCVDCADKISRIAERQKQEQFLESIQRANMMNFILEQAESLSVGQPGFLRRMPIPQIAPTTVVGGITLNNIHVDRSSVGILNAGQMEGIQRIDINISRLDKTSDPSIAEALKALTQAVLSDQAISTEQRDDLLDQLHGLSDQALLPPEKRKSGVIKAIITGLAGGLNAVSGLATIWSTWGGTIRTHFGL